jgi:hypothetical protein
VTGIKKHGTVFLVTVHNTYPWVHLKSTKLFRPNIQMKSIPDNLIVKILVHFNISTGKPFKGYPILLKNQGMKGFYPLLQSSLDDKED